MVPAAPPCRVFLDLAWPGSAPRRVVIQLSPDTPRGRQFVLLCTGQQGPCYPNTRLYKVMGKGWPGERVYGGDNQNNDLTEVAALLPQPNESEYRRSARAGAVWRLWGCRGAQFGIITRDCQDSRFSDFEGVFGEVVDGLEGVVAAAQHSPITDVTVVDCGVVLWE